MALASAAPSAAVVVAEVGYYKTPKLFYRYLRTEAEPAEDHSTTFQSTAMQLTLHCHAVWFSYQVL